MAIVENKEVILLTEERKEIATGDDLWCQLIWVIINKMQDLSLFAGITILVIAYLHH